MVWNESLVKKAIDLRIFILLRFFRENIMRNTEIYLTESFPEIFYSVHIIHR